MFKNEIILSLLISFFILISSFVKAEVNSKIISSLEVQDSEDLEPYIMDFDELDYISIDLRNKYLKIIKPLLLKLPVSVYSGEKILLETSNNEKAWKALQLKIKISCQLKENTKTCDNLMDARSNLFTENRARK